MAIFESEKTRENLTGSTTDTTYDSLIVNKGLEADNWTVTKLREIYQSSNHVKELPIFNVSAGTVNGSAAPQYIKDLATNRATMLCFLSMRQLENAKMYRETLLEQLQAIMTDLQVTEEATMDFAIV